MPLILGCDVLRSDVGRRVVGHGRHDAARLTRDSVAGRSPCVRGRRSRNRIAGSPHEHRPGSGARAHRCVHPDDINAVAVTQAPGSSARCSSVSYAKAVAHGKAHRSSACTTWRDISSRHPRAPDAVPPFTALLVSGGHTLLLDVEAWGRTGCSAPRATTPGEAFDKVAKLLGLPYRADRQSSRWRLKGSPGHNSVSPAPCCARTAARRSGLLRRLVQRSQDRRAQCGAGGRRTSSATKHNRARLSGRAHRTLVEKSSRAAEHSAAQRIVLGGGVACNPRSRRPCATDLTPRSELVYAPTPRLATDNAAMIARAGLFTITSVVNESLGLDRMRVNAIPGYRSQNP